MNLAPRITSGSTFEPFSSRQRFEAEGFEFAGVAPHFSPRGDLLRLVNLVAPLEREPIKTYDEPAARLVEYALADQIRVRAAL